MKLLIHGCCADCTLKFTAELDKEILEEAAVYFYNPNIQPRAEYQARLGAIIKVCREKNIKLIIADWSPRDYFSKITTRLGRCQKCWELRLEKTAKAAKEGGYSHFSSTLLSSQYQNREKVAEIGGNWAKRLGVDFYHPDKIGREIENKGFYKQFFCGCVYSLEERYREKYKG